MMYQLAGQLTEAETKRVMQDDDALEHLVAAAQGGDQAALDEVLLRIRPMVLRRCTKFLPHHADAEDAAQDALLIISRKLTSYAGRGSFLGWVTVIASNSARSTYRSLRDRADALSGVGAVPDAPDPRTTSVIAGTRLDLLDALDELEQSHPALVESFILRDLGELSYQEIADLTKTRMGTVKDRIHRARKFMEPRLRAGTL
jgi:RNA polymerase sigma-70 factor (ECF subfamily)